MKYSENCCEFKTWTIISTTTKNKLCKYNCNYNHTTTTIRQTDSTVTVIVTTLQLP